MSMDDLIQSILGGGSAQQQQSSGGGLEDILGAIMGGGSVPQQQPSGGGLEDILGAIMGGGSAQQQQPSGGGLMDIISAILGGGGAQQSASPIIEGVSGRTGLSQVIVQMILSFVMSKLLGSLSGGASGQSGYSPSQQSGGGLDLDGLLEQMGHDKGVARELAEQTGLDSQTAKKGLDEILSALGAQRQASAGQSQPAEKGGLDGLLENW